MISCDRWRQGPEFLWQDETAWPTKPAVSEITCEDKEAKNQAKCCVSNVQYDTGDRRKHDTPSSDKEQELGDPMNRFIESYSCWHRLKKSVPWLVRCKDWLRAKTNGKERPPSVIADPLDPLELQAVETAIVKSVQQRHFKGEVRDLKSRKPVGKKGTIYVLEPFLDEEGLLRVGGRPKNAPMPEKAQHLIILPKNDHVTRLVAR